MANKTGVYPVYENQFKIDKTGGTGATAENLVTIADIDVYKRQGKGFADRGLFIPVQLLCGKLLKRCGHNVRVPAFEKHKVTGLFALNLFQRKIYVVFLRGTLKGFDIAVGDLDVGNPRILLHKLPHGLFPMRCFAFLLQKLLDCFL